jgi:hypothetical protein
MFKEQHNRWIKIARATEARVGTLTLRYSIVPDSLRAVQVAHVQAVALYESEPWRYLKEAGRWDQMKLLLNW